MLTYSFEKSGSENLYTYLYKCIRDDIVSGAIRPGEKLPSKRSFAENLGISVVTVENAYAQLVSEGYLYSLPKKGFFAAEIGHGHAVVKREGIPAVKLPDAPKYFADFSGNRTDPENFPFSTWTKLMREVISEKSAELMVNAPCGGVPELREAIAAHLYDFRGIQADPNHIIVGAGTEYLYGLLIQLLPGAYDEAIDRLEENVKNLEPVTTMLAKGMSILDICKTALQGFEVEVLDENPVNYVCSCSREKLERYFMTMSDEEIRTLPDESGKTEAVCQFCNKRYAFTRDDLERLIAEKNS